MAITFRQASSSNTGSASSLTISKPENTANGDIMFALVTAVNYTVNSVPTGWTLIVTIGTGYGWESALYYKIASSEGSDYTWGFNGYGRVRISIASYYGDFNASNPIGVLSDTAYTVNDSIVRASSMNVPVANSPLFFIGFGYNTSTLSFTKPSTPTTNWTEDLDAWGATSDIGHIFCSMVWTSSGSTGDMDATSNRNINIKHAFAFSLNLPVVAPTVTTQAVSSIDKTTATGNGNITNTGGANATRRGFCYLQGSSGDPTTANSVVYDDGSFGTGAYTKAITGLTPNTTYMVRAYAVNSAGTSYGSTVSFTTLKADESNFLLFM